MLNIIIAPKKKKDRFMDVETMGGTSNITNIATFVIGIDVGDNIAEVLKIRNSLPYIRQGTKFSVDMIPFIVDYYLKHSLE